MLWLYLGRKSCRCFKSPNKRRGSLHVLHPSCDLLKKLRALLFVRERQLNSKHPPLFVRDDHLFRQTYIFNFRDQRASKQHQLMEVIWGYEHTIHDFHVINITYSQSQKNPLRCSLGRRLMGCHTDPKLGETSLTKAVAGFNYLNVTNRHIDLQLRGIFYVFALTK